MTFSSVDLEWRHQKRHGASRDDVSCCVVSAVELFFFSRRGGSDVRSFLHEVRHTTSHHSCIPESEEDCSFLSHHSQTSYSVNMLCVSHSGVTRARPVRSTFAAHNC